MGVKECYIIDSDSFFKHLETFGCSVSYRTHPFNGFFLFAYVSTGGARRGRENESPPGREREAPEPEKRCCSKGRQEVVTTSKALVTTSEALVTSSFFFEHTKKIEEIDAGRGSWLPG